MTPLTHSAQSSRGKPVLEYPESNLHIRVVRAVMIISVEDTQDIFHMINENVARNIRLIMLSGYEILVYAI